MGPGSPGTWTPPTLPAQAKRVKTRGSSPGACPPPPNIKLYTQRTNRICWHARTHSKPHCTYPYPCCSSLGVIFRSSIFSPAGLTWETVRQTKRSRRLATGAPLQTLIQGSTGTDDKPDVREGSHVLKPQVLLHVYWGCVTRGIV